MDFHVVSMRGKKLGLRIFISVADKNIEKKQHSLGVSSSITVCVTRCCLIRPCITIIER